MRTQSLRRALVERYPIGFTLGELARRKPVFTGKRVDRRSQRIRRAAERADHGVTLALLLPVLWGALMAAALNASNNAVNQIYDLEIDRVNKGKRPLPSGRMTMAEAWRFTVIAYALTLVLAAWLASPLYCALTR